MRKREVSIKNEMWEREGRGEKGRENRSPGRMTRLERCHTSPRQPVRNATESRLSDQLTGFAGIWSSRIRLISVIR